MVAPGIWKWKMWNMTSRSILAWGVPSFFLSSDQVVLVICCFHGIQYYPHVIFQLIRRISEPEPNEFFHGSCHVTGFFDLMLAQQHGSPVMGHHSQGASRGVDHRLGQWPEEENQWQSTGLLQHPDVARDKASWFELVGWSQSSITENLVV